MANEILYSGLGDARAAEAISGEFIKLFAGPTSLPSHPAIRYCGSVNGSGSLVKTVAHYGFGGYDQFSSTAEGTAASNVALTTGASSITVARLALQREVGSLARLTDPHGVLTSQALAADSFASYGRTVIDLVANVTDGYTATQTSTSIMTLEDFFAAKSKLAQANAPGPYLAILHPKQWGELEAEIAGSAGGSVAYDPATPALIAANGPGMVGTLGGVTVFTTTSVPSSGGDYKGAMLASDAVVWADGQPEVQDANNQLAVGDKVLYTRILQNKGSALELAECYLGVALGVDARGVTMISDVA